MDIARAVKQAATPSTTAGKPAKAGKAVEKPEAKFEDELMAVAEQLIVKGKEQGYLTPDDVLQGFPEIDAEPEQIFRIFAAFKEIGIEVTDGEKDFEEVEQIDDEMLLDIEMMDSVSLDDPVRMYLKEIGRVSLLTANDEVELAQAIEAKPLHDAMKALNVIEEIDGRQRSVDELLPEVIERLATVKRKGQQAHIAQELLGLGDLSRLDNLTDAAAAERRRLMNGARPRVRAEALEHYRIARYRLTERYERAYESPTRRGPSASRCTWSRRSTSSSGFRGACCRSSAASLRMTRSARRWGSRRRRCARS